LPTKVVVLLPTKVVVLLPAKVIYEYRQDSPLNLFGADKVVRFWKKEKWLEAQNQEITRPP